MTCSPRRRRALARALAACVACTLATALAPLAAASPPSVQAHRGGPLADGRPLLGENTIGAFGAARQAGWRVELDVRLSRDGVPVVIHDPGLARVTDCSGLVRHRTAAQLARCTVDRPAATREPVATLAAALGAPGSRDGRWSVELKDVAGRGARARLARRAASVLDRSGIPVAALSVMSFEPALLRLTARRIRARHRRLRGVRLVLLRRRRDGRDRPAARRAVRGARAVGARWVAAKWPVSRSYVRAVHARGLRVAVWTSPQNRASHVTAAADSGVDSVITDDPSEAQARIAAWCRARGCGP